MGRKKVLLHLGTDKTGSTSIQEALKKSYIEGDLDGVVYPDIGDFLKKSHGAHGEVVAIYKSYSEIMNQRSLIDLRDKYRNDRRGYEGYISRIERKYFSLIGETDRLILSWESLFSQRNGVCKRLVADLQRAGFDDIQAVVYLREPSAYYLSRCQQKLKTGFSIEAPKTFACNYKVRLDRWSDLLDIEVRDFEAIKKESGGVVTDFQEMARKFFGAKVTLQTGTNLNESLSAEAMVCLQDYRRLYHCGRERERLRDATKLKNYMREAESVEVVTKPRLNSWAINSIRKNNYEDIDFLKNNHRFSWSFENCGANDIVEGDLAESGGGFVAVEEILERFDKDVARRLVLRAFRRLYSQDVRRKS